MAKDSQYNKDLRKKQDITIKRLRDQMPVYMASYFRDLENDAQPNTIIAYERDLITFLEFLCSQNPLLKGKACKDIPESILEQLTFEDINDYQEYLKSFEDANIKHSNGKRSIARKMAALRGFFNFQCEHNYLSNNPTIGVSKRKKKEEKDIVRMNVKEVNALLSCVESSYATTKREQIFAEKAKYRDTALLTLLLNTGIRVSECVGLDLSDVNFDESTITIVRKGGKEAILYFNDSTYDALMDYIELERKKYDPDKKISALFLSSHRKRLTVRSVEKIVKKYAQRAVPSKHITPHKLRSTYGTSLYQSTGDIKLVADVLGHKDINTTSKFYAASELEHRRKAAELNLYK